MRKHIDSSSADEDEILIESLLQRRVDAIAPRPAFYHELYGKLMRSHINERAKRPGMLHMLDFLLVGKKLATAVILFIFIASSSIVTSYAYSSTDVTRESNLYILKEAVENLRIALSTAPDAKAAVQLDLADRRKDELSYLTGQGRVDAQTVNRMLDSIRQASLLSDQVTEDAKRAELKELINKSSRDKKEELLQLIALLENQAALTQGGANSSQDSSEANPVESGNSVSSAATTLSSDNQTDIVSLRETATALGLIEQATQSSPAVPQASETSLSSSDTVLRHGIASSRETLQTETASVSSVANLQQVAPPNRNEIHSMTDIRLSIEGTGIFSVQSDATMMLVVDNIGETAADAFVIGYDWGDGNKDSVMVDSLAIGERKSIPVSHYYNNAGQFFLNAVANSSRTVRESSETNNSKRAFIQINAGSPVCSSDCDAVGNKRCANNGVSTCIQKGNNCLQWSQAISCGDAICSSGSCKITH